MLKSVTAIEASLYCIVYCQEDTGQIFLTRLHEYLDQVEIQPVSQYFYTDRSKAILLLWFLTVTCSCSLYLYFGSAIMLVIYFVNFR